MDPITRLLNWTRALLLRRARVLLLTVGTRSAAPEYIVGIERGPWEQNLSFMFVSLMIVLNIRGLLMHILKVCVCVCE